jgi:LEA14-like dessication related protein
MALKGMQYQVFVNDQAWASGETGEQVPLTERGNGLVRIPISLDLLRMGTSIADLLRDSEPLSVRLLGDLDLNTSLPLLDHAHIPFDLRSDTEITRP